MQTLLFAALLATGASVDSSIPAADSAVTPNVVVRWFNGGLVNVGTNTACISDPPIFQVRTSGYAGFSYLPPSNPPGVGEVFYTHVLVSHPGNPCGGSVVGLELILPPGIQTAISTTDPVFCFGITPNNVLFNYANEATYGCPQTLPQGLEGLAVRAPRGGAGGGGWAMRQGSWMEIFVPLKSSVVQNGDQKIRWRLNPAIAVVGYLETPVFVDDDVIFRTSQEDIVLPVELCSGSQPPQGC
ncbi:hypothetical protein [Tahibacter soli]|uniref:Uncharacterized protein n=1 Tax=Tahibacter soli TaxID=2983605 RepID=A0A9X4BIC9_9GAMM|nr:hypothetical protein [Tahibacter soli]MDC8012102.1 hypothetical protein [Tahibacter soli]